ncbi:MAG TPA: sigma-70 family RNA polymerase sigma factor, partial [Planctomycetota bacterium]|nr:sigma-70 family RNA polymerase sigma factor [Planctomycetota bacterium]
MSGELQGGTAAEFPRTPVSRLARLQDGDARRRQHLEKLCELYWRPVYAFIRRLGSADRDKAEDLTQDFFAWAFERDLLLKFDPACGNFRAFLKAVLRNFVREDHRRATADKRGGSVRFVSAEAAEAVAVPADLPPEEAFDRQWVHDVLEQAVRQLERELEAQGRGAWFQALRLYDLEDRSA